MAAGRGAAGRGSGSAGVGGLRAGVAALLLLVVAGCAVPEVPPEPPLSYPPAVRERVVRIALAEWEEWGRLLADPVQPRDDGAGRAGTPGPEAAPGNFPRVLAYWRAVPEDEGAVARNRARYRAALAAPVVPAGGNAPRAEPARLWAEPPWSAAFISYVMRAAGVDLREFPPSAAHSTYVDALIGDAVAFPELAPFVPRAPEAYAPAVGDLVCADRSARPLRDWRERAAERGRFRPMHCDIVVGVAPGVVEAVGGNVRDAVTLTRFPTDPRGVLLPLPPGAPVWFAVFENRLGRLPPWGPAVPSATVLSGRRLSRTLIGSPAS